MTQLAAHQGIVEENAACAILARKNAVLIRQVDPGGVDQIYDRDAVPHRDLLSPEDLGYGFRPPGAGLYRGVIGYDHCRAVLDLPDTRNNARRGRLAFILVISNK